MIDVRLILVLAASATLLVGCNRTGGIKTKETVSKEALVKKEADVDYQSLTTRDHLDPWIAGTPHPTHPNLFAGNKPGEWLPAPGYVRQPGLEHWGAFWAPGTPHPTAPNILASAVEKEWVPAPGYAWENNDPRTFRAVRSTKAKVPPADEFDQRLVGTWELRIQNGFADVVVVTYLHVKFEADGSFVESSSGFANGNNLTWVNAGADEKGRVSRSGNTLTFTYESGKTRSTTYEVAKGGVRFGRGEWYLKE